MDPIISIASFVSSKESSLNMLISNAGVHLVLPNPSGPVSSANYSILQYQEALLSLRPMSWDMTYRVNVSAHYYLTVMLLPLLAQAAEKGDGRGASSKAATGRFVRLMGCKVCEIQDQSQLTSPRKSVLFSFENAAANAKSSLWIVRATLPPRI